MTAVASDAAHSLRASLDVVRAALHPALVAPHVVERLRGVAATLPAVHRAGFECRLGRDDERVDVQQAIIPNRWEPAALTAFAASRECDDPAARDAWSRLVAVADAWQTGDDAGVMRSVSELWLEFDVGTNDCGDSPAPSVFMVFGAVKPRGADGGGSLVRGASELLLDAGGASALARVVDRCARAAASEGAWLSHLGVMLGRRPTGVRIHVSALRFSRFDRFLEAIGWVGDVDAVRESAALLFDHADELVLCLDAAVLPDAARLLPRIGLEAFFAQKTGVDPRWAPLLEALSRRGLAAPDKCAALLEWPGTVTPLTATAWPDDLVIRTLTAPPSHLGYIERRLSHVKLHHDGTAAPTAKAYFGYGHLWGMQGAATAAPPPVASTPPVAIADAVEAAEQFLLCARNQAGWWRDFYDLGRSSRPGERVTGYASDEWVTAYVGAQLAGTGRPAATDAARDAWGLLARRRDATSGWGYHAQLPPDADSTVWALRLARLLGVPVDARLSAARAFLDAQTRDDGSVTCYRPEDCGAIARFLRMSGPYDGWCAAHTCITAAAAGLDGDPRHLAHLRRAQRSDGGWSAHWWDDDEYAVTWAVDALARAGSSGAASRGAAWAAARIDERGAVGSRAHGGPSVFATSLALLSIVAAGGARHLDVAARAARWLRAQQRADGSFPPSARLRVPAPWAVDPLASPETTLVYLDRDAVFTTAQALAALAAFTTARNRAR